MPNPPAIESEIDVLYTTLHKYTAHQITLDELLQLIGEVPLLFNLLTASIEHTDTTHYITVKQCITRIATDNHTLLQSNDMIQYYTYGLNYHDENIRSYTIELITLLCKSDESWLIQHNHKLFDQLCTMLVNDNSLIVISSLHKLFDTVQNKSILLSKMNEQTKQYQSLDNQQIIKLLRVYDVLINIIIYNKSIDTTIQDGTINNLLSLYDKLSIDPLSRLNVLELLQTFITQSQSINTTQQINIIEHIVQSINSNDAVSNLILGPIFDLVDKISLKSRKQGNPIEYSLSTYHELYNIFTHILNDRSIGDTLLAQCIGCMSSIATTYTGLQLLIQNDILYRIGKFVSNTGDVLKLSSLHSIEIILNTIYKSDQQHEIMSIKHKLFDSIGAYRNTSTMSILQPMLKLPFTELKLKTYSVIESLAALPIAFDILISHTPGFIEYLVNRNNEATINGQTAKYSVINALINNSQFHTIDKTIQKQLIDYKDTGLYTIEQQTRVMDPVYRPA